ncbi:MAG: DNA topoisomerase III [Burkholderiales bacterium]|nr:MAG: DNA topoisomerase III [Burkholderiales bacterium]
MPKPLIIAEKPSVAADIARALGGFTRHGDYYESDDYLLSSALGHLVEIAAPEQYEVKRGKWSFTHLPVIPPRFDLKPIDKNSDRLKLLTRLIRRKDVDRIINACDAGREGELIFRLIVQHAKARQPVQRLWLQSMTPAAIRQGFESLRSDTELIPLADAARCRSEADWLVGINGTRAMTAFNSRDGGFFLTTVGRVQTPTLAIVVEREERIRRFVARDYFEVRATFETEAGRYEGRWFDPDFRKDESDPERRAERIWERGRAEDIRDACVGRDGFARDEAKPSTQFSPALFDLTSLQREANGRFGFSARMTLSIAQALYEKHKALTYPRTDSRALPEDYPGTVRETMKMLTDAGAYEAFARRVLEQGWIKPSKRVFDNAKVSDHFAIIPTLQRPKSLSETEQKIYDLVTRRFLAVFFPPAEYLVTTRITEVNAHAFRTEGRVLVEPGWLAIYGREAADPDSSLPAIGPVTPGAAGKPATAAGPVSAPAVEVFELTTKPPARYSEATLLSAMEGAGKLLEDDELRSAMAGKGLGTPATRAAIIEGLIDQGYMHREGRELVATAKAFQLLTLLRGLGVAELTLPELTGEWEHKLSQMEHGGLARETFMREIAEMTRRIVEQAKGYGRDTVPGDYATLETPCPSCGATVRENYRRFACESCDFSITKTPAGRLFEIDEVEQLLRDGSIGPLQGFRSKQGRPFAAILRITPEHKLEFDFGQQNGEAGDSEEAPDFSDQTPLGTCPKCGGSVFEHGLSYVCEHAVGPQRSCDFRSGKIILQQPVERAQMSRLLETGRTELLNGFVSNRTRRKFKAYLVRGSDGRIGFEFEARAPRKGAARAAAPGAGGEDAPATDAGATKSSRASPAKAKTKPRKAGASAAGARTRAGAKRAGARAEGRTGKGKAARKGKGEDTASRAAATRRNAQGEAATAVPGPASRAEAPPPASGTTGEGTAAGGPTRSQRGKRAA